MEWYVLTTQAFPYLRSCTQWTTATLGLETYRTNRLNFKLVVQIWNEWSQQRSFKRRTGSCWYIPYPVRHEDKGLPYSGTVPVPYSSISSAAQSTYRNRSTYVQYRPQLVKNENSCLQLPVPWRSPSWQTGLPPPLPPFPECPPLPPCPPSHSFYLKATPAWLKTISKVAIVKQSYKQLQAEAESMRKTNTFPLVRVNFYVLYIIEG